MESCREAYSCFVLVFLFFLPTGLKESAETLKREAKLRESERLLPPSVSPTGTPARKVGEEENECCMHGESWLYYRR